MTCYYVVAVFWGSQGYGKGKRCDTIEDACIEVEKLKRSGFGDGLRSGKIHTIKKTPDEITEASSISALRGKTTEGGGA